MVKIYVRLIDEGTEVFRPVSAERVGDCLYRLSAQPDYVPDEKWEFVPGTIVEGEKRVLSGEEVLVATKAIPEA